MEVWTNTKVPLTENTDKCTNVYTHTHTHTSRIQTYN